MRVLVTGSTGLVGNNCLRELANQYSDLELHALVRHGHDNRPLDSLTLPGIAPTTQIDPPESPSVEIHRHYGDLSQPESLRDIVPDVDVVIHSAADTHIGKLARPNQKKINVDATAWLAEFAREQDARFVFVSSVDALPAGSPKTWVNEESTGEAKYSCGYVDTKRAAEESVKLCIDKGLNGFIVNPGFVLGPWDWKPSSGRMLLDVATKLTPFGPKGGISVCDARQVATAICKLAIHGAPSRRYILAGNNIRYLEAWRIFAKVTHGPKLILPAGPLMKIVAGKWGDAMGKIRGQEGDINSASIGMSELYHYYDSSRAVDELEYRIVPVEESASLAWAWFRLWGYA